MCTLTLIDIMIHLHTHTYTHKRYIHNNVFYNVIRSTTEYLKRVHQREIKSDETQKIDKKEQCIYTHTHTHILLPSNNQQKCSKYIYTTHTHSITRKCKLGSIFPCHCNKCMSLHNHYKNINTIGKSPLTQLCPKYYYFVVK